MPKNVFLMNVRKLAPKVSKQDMVLRRAVSADVRVVATLFRLATGSNYFHTGDAGYVLRDWLMMPYSLNSNSTSAQRLFTERQIRGRICVERAFGILNARWQILSVGITSSTSWTARIVHACCVLHNMLAKLRVQVHDSYAVAVGMNCPSKELIQSGLLSSRRGRNSGQEVRAALSEYLMLSTQ
ncbi:hypothetical protein R1sor_012994 [Riccia sorocarpa]|uniref:DDE Tnp4 domain-containing protein n=1 Tax=Riccia sorocarpa TaxID=122646 RepID=A0ABD3H591_9MARC